MKKLLSLSILLSCSFSIGYASGCKQIVPNVEICADKAKFGAVCANTRDDSKKRTQIAKFDWDRKRVGWFCMSPDALGKYQKFIQLSCARQKNCVDEVNNFVNNLKGNSK